jgi:cyclopropane-fatty-acyl-phospholipid synthase
MAIQERLRYSMLDRALGLGVIPDPVLRAASRAAARSRLSQESSGGPEAQEERLQDIVRLMSSGPIAEQTQAANDQHYEVPSEFFELFLGPRRKYSSAYFANPEVPLDRAEEEMLALTCGRAGITDGMNILDLGCGWGSLSLWMAEKFPRASITAVSNSATQRQTIEADAERRGLGNLKVITADVNSFDPGKDFDRVVSVEMFEHMRNWKELLRRVSTWLRPEGRLFVHIFTHRTLAYRFAGTWASERFFTAGTMPSHDLPLFFQEHLRVECRWAMDGNHYARTLGAWLKRLDARRPEALSILEPVYGRKGAKQALGNWRLFLISTEQIWKWNDGNDWMVSHYLFSPRG